MIPVKYLDKVGNYSLNIDGSVVKVKVADCEAAIDKEITKFLQSSYTIIGTDFKTVGYIGTKDPYGVLVLCGGGAGDCLVIYLEYLHKKVPGSLKKLLDNPDFCFVRASEMEYNYALWVKGATATPVRFIEAGNLAAQVLIEPNLKGSSLRDIASAVGVSSKDLGGSSLGSRDIRVGGYARVLTPEQMKTAIADAYMCYKIGVKLLCSS